MFNQITSFIMRYLYFTLLLLGMGLATSCVDSDEDLFGERLEIGVENIDKDIRVNIGDVLEINPQLLLQTGSMTASGVWPAKATLIQ